MTKSFKAALLSALVFPGVGHLYLRKYLIGVALIGAALYPLYILIDYTIRSAEKIVNKIISGEIQPDLVVIRDLISQQQTAPEAQQLSWVTTALVIIWVIGIIDSYRIGRMKATTA